MHLTILPIVIFALALPLGEGKRCYECNSEDGDWRCLDNPDSVPSYIRECDKKYCTIFRQELVNEKGKVNTFRRFCQDKVLFYDKIVTDSQFKTFYRSCTHGDLCNKGDGTKPLGGGGDDDDSTQVFIVPGYQDTNIATWIHPNHLLLVSLATIICALAL